MSIEFEKNEAGNTATIVIKGGFNFDSNAEFRRAMGLAVESQRKIIVDMAMVDRIDSSALGMLLLLREQCGGSSSGIRIIKCKQDIRDVLKMANFQSVFDIDEL